MNWRNCSFCSKNVRNHCFCLAVAQPPCEANTNNNNKWIQYGMWWTWIRMRLALTKPQYLSVHRTALVWAVLIKVNNRRREDWEQPQRGGCLVFTDIYAPLLWTKTCCSRLSIRLDILNFSGSLAAHFFSCRPFQWATVASAMLIRCAGMDFLIFALGGFWDTLWSPKHFSVSTPETSPHWQKPLLRVSWWTLGVAASCSSSQTAAAAASQC